MKQIAEKRKNIQIFYKQAPGRPALFSARQKDLKEENVPEDFVFEQKGVLYTVKQWLHSAKQSIRETFSTSVWRNLYLTRIQSGDMVSVIPQKYVNDAEIVETLMRQYPMGTYFLQRGPELKYNEDLCVLACLLNPENIRHLPFEKQEFVNRVLIKLKSFVYTVIQQQLREKVNDLPAPFQQEEKIGENKVAVYRMHYVPALISKEPAKYALLPMVAKEIYEIKKGEKVFVSSTDLSAEESKKYITAYSKGSATVEDALKNMKVVQETYYADLVERKTYYCDGLSNYNLTLMERTDRVAIKTGSKSSVTAVASYDDAKAMMGKLNLPLEMFDFLKMINFELYRVQEMHEDASAFVKLDVIGQPNAKWKDNGFLTFGKERCITMYAHKAPDAKEGKSEEGASAPRTPDFYMVTEGEGEATTEENGVGYYIDAAYSREELVSILETTQKYMQNYMRTKQQKDEQEMQR